MTRVSQSSDHVPFLSNSQRERLVLLIEECAEVQQAASKILRHGYDSFHPSKPKGRNNKKELEKELGDLKSAIDLLQKDVNLQVVEIWRSKKPVKRQRYLHWN